MPTVEGAESHRTRRRAGDSDWHGWTAATPGDPPALGGAKRAWPPPSQPPRSAMKRRELVMRRAIPAILAVVVLVVVVLPLLLGIASAGTAIARILRRG